MFHRSERLFLRPAFPEDSAAIQTAIGEAAGPGMARPARAAHTLSQPVRWRSSNAL